MPVSTSSVTLVNLDSTNFPNGRQLEGGLGIQLSDEGPGGALIISADDFLLSLQNVSTNGFLVRSNTNTAVSRTLTSDGTIQITNPTGAGGNPQLSIANNSTIQKVVSAAYGTDRATQGRLNFIGAGGVGVTVANNGTLNSADITISGSGGAPQLAAYILTVPYSGVTNGFALSNLATGLLKNTTSTGVPTIAVAGTDYLAPSTNLTAISGLTPSLGSMIVGTGSTYVSRSIGAAGTVPVSTGSDWAWSSAAFTNPMTAVGDLIIGGTAGAPNRLPVGTNGQVLSVVSGSPAWAAPGAGPSAAATYIVQTADSSLSNEQSLGLLTTGLLKNTVTSATGVLSTAVAGTDYQAPSANLTAVSGLAITKGSILVSNGTAISQIAVGANGQALVADSTQVTGLNYASLATNPMTTLGDIVVGGASGAPTRLGIGTNGQVLTVSGGAVTWAADSSTAVYSGNTTLVAGTVTVTLSGCVGTSKIVPSYNGSPTNPGVLYVVPGTGSFTITSTNAADVSNLSWIAVL